MKEAADRAGVELLPFYAASRDEYPSVFAAMRSAGAEALEIISAPELYTDAAMLAELAAETRLPTICEWADMAQSGCLLGYGSRFRGVGAPRGELRRAHLSRRSAGRSSDRKTDPFPVRRQFENRQGARAHLATSDLGPR